MSDGGASGGGTSDGGASEVLGGEAPLWGEFIGDYAKHLVSRYGEDICSRFIFEVWK